MRIKVAYIWQCFQCENEQEFSIHRDSIPQHCGVDMHIIAARHFTPSPSDNLEEVIKRFQCDTPSVPPRQ